MEITMSEENNNINNNFSQMPDKNTSEPITIGSYQWPPIGVNQSSAPKKEEKKKMGAAGISALLILVCILTSAVFGCGGAYITYNYLNERNLQNDNPVQSQQTIIQQATIDKTNEENNESALVSAINRAYDSNVEISTETVTTSTFYGQYVTDGAGSGVIISSDGYILTCAHVVSGSTSVTVTLSDKTEYPATIVGSDEQTDIAVLKIEAEGLTPAIIGDSSALTLGQTTIAIGNPLGELGGTVTSGIVSALERDVEIDIYSYKLIQTNAAINPGNSGGGLFDINGLLIGIVNAKSAGSEIEGLGFAIPINRAMEVAEQLMNFGYIKGRPQLGVTVYDVTSSTNYWNLRAQEPALIDYVTDYGVYVVDFTAGDFKYGDRIIAIDGILVTGLSDIKSVLSEYAVGDTVEVTVSRLNERGQSKSVSFELVLSESKPTEQSTEPVTPETDEGVLNGDDFEVYPSPEFDISDIFGDLFGN